MGLEVILGLFSGMRKENEKKNWCLEKENIFSCTGGVSIKDELLLYSTVSGVLMAIERINVK